MISLTKASKLIGISVPTLKNNLKYYDSQLYVINSNRIWLDMSLIEQLIKDKKYIDNSYTMKQSSKILGFNNDTIKKMLDNEFSDYKKLLGFIRIPKSSVDNLNKALQKYLMINEAAEILNINEQAVRELIYSNYFKNVKKVRVFLYIEKKEILKYKQILDSKKNYCNISEAARLIGINTRKIKEELLDVEFKTYTKTKHEFLLDKDEVLKYIEKLKRIEDQYYDIREVSNLLKLTKIDLYKFLKKNSIDIEKSETNKELVRKHYIDNYIAYSKNLYTIGEVRHIIGCSASFLNDYFRRFEVEAIRDGKWKKIDAGLLEKIKYHYAESINKQQIMKSNNIDTKIEYLINKGIDKKSKEIFVKYIHCSYTKSNSKDKDKKLSPLISALNEFYKLFNKDITTISDFEIESILKSNIMSIERKRIISDFIKYCTKHFKDECKFEIKFNIYSKQKKYEKEIDKIYTEEVWFKYYRYLTNIQFHIMHAMSDEKYAEVWLFTILHLSLSWRKGDIVEIPILNNEMLCFTNFEWLYCNTFTIGMAEKTMKNLSDVLYGKITNKTREKLHFVMPLNLLLPTAIAYSICCIHKVKSGKNICSVFTNSHFKNNVLRRFFKEDDLKEFSSLKANRTILTYSFNNAVNTPGNAELSYTLSSYMRSHKYKKNSEFAPVTAQYIYTTNGDGSINDITYNLFNRGHFGDLYKLLIEIINNNHCLDTNELTKLIVKYKQRYSPIEIEGIVMTANNSRSVTEKVLGEVLLKDRNELKITIDRLIQNKLYSKEPYIQCLKSGKCQYELKTECLGCKYSLPMRYCVYSLYNKISTLVRSMHELKRDDNILIKKYSYFLSKYLMILNQLKLEYREVDECFLENIINVKSLFDDIKDLYKKKLYLVD
jgi:hypothetical protein